MVDAPRPGQYRCISHLPGKNVSHRRGRRVRGKGEHYQERRHGSAPENPKKKTPLQLTKTTTKRFLHMASFDSLKHLFFFFYPLGR